MKNWKDRIWLLVLVIVGSSIMTHCKSGGSGGGNSTTNLAFANGFKPSDVSGVLVCWRSSDFTGGAFYACVSNTDNSNYSGRKYIYLAFAETPFKYSNAR